MACERLARIEDIIFSEDGKEKVTLDRLKELVEADREGKAIILPCKRGDTIYHKTRLSDTIVAAEIKQIVINGFGFAFRVERGNNIGVSFDEDDIGDRVFLTREAAENALEVGKDGEELDGDL